MSTTLQSTAESGERSTSYSEALKSTAWIGGASVIHALLAIVRTKFVASVLGPAGVGLMGAYTSITAMMGTLAGMGIQSSGVRQIAEAAGEGDEAGIAAAAQALRQVTRLLGAAGGILTAALAPWLSQWTFGNRDHAWALAILATTVSFGCITGGQTALLQGLRRVTDLVRVRIAGSIAGTAIAVPLVWLMGMQAIVPLMVAVAGTAVLTSWWYARRAPVARVDLSWIEALRPCAPLLKLGLAMMLTALMAALVGYLLRLLILRRLGLEAAGQYQAAATLSMMYVGFVLTAMGTDFYPRLTAVCKDHSAMGKVLNEQVEISILLATPGLLATLALAPLVIRAFYSRAFGDAVEVLQWQTVGTALRVVSWPLAYAILARGQGTIYFLTELFANVLHFALIWWGIGRFGLAGTGIAFALMYGGYWAVVYWTVRGGTGVHYSAPLRRLIVGSLAAIALVFIASRELPGLWHSAVGTGIAAVVGVYCINALATRAPQLRPSRWWRRLTGQVI